VNSVLVESQDRDATWWSVPSWFGAFARERVRGLLDAGSFEEFIGPEYPETSPHLSLFDLPERFDDGMIVGRGLLDNAPVLIAAQEGRFMCGAFGEVHGAKLTGLLRAARDIRSMPVLILFDTGGVRLQEANAGDLAIAEIMRAVIEARLAGAPVVGLVGGRAGCYGGGSLIAGCGSAVVVSEQRRISVSGPEVIETSRGVEEFDSKDRASVWRTMGGRHRRLIGGAEMFVDDTVPSFREAARRLIKRAPPLNVATLATEQYRLVKRIERFGACTDAVDVWRSMGATEPQAIPAMAYQDCVALADRLEEPAHDAR